MEVPVITSKDLCDVGLDATKHVVSVIVGCPDSVVDQLSYCEKTDKDRDSQDYDQPQIISLCAGNDTV